MSYTSFFFFVGILSHSIYQRGFSPLVKPRHSSSYPCFLRLICIMRELRGCHRFLCGQLIPLNTHIRRLRMPPNRRYHQHHLNNRLIPRLGTLQGHRFLCGQLIPLNTHLRRLRMPPHRRDHQHRLNHRPFPRLRTLLGQRRFLLLHPKLHLKVVDFSRSLHPRLFVSLSGIHVC